MKTRSGKRYSSRPSHKQYAKIINDQSETIRIQHNTINNLMKDWRDILIRNANLERQLILQQCDFANEKQELEMEVANNLDIAMQNEQLLMELRYNNVEAMEMMDEPRFNVASHKIVRTLYWHHCQMNVGYLDANIANTS
ncbi:hypothetical protein C1645_835008 [Glomus cerebriforme]|uniref:Uncharacterized protein n=1 Tax=Glomus cerebriforme TaxID=658196 RepID=A0A397SJI2_9GLOM|nr:hypothetical protein C1645_835008 [Glomus cerebriforme]